MSRGDLNVHSFPSGEKVKARLKAVCKLLNISLKEWFDTALIESEHDVLISEQKSRWDANFYRFVRSSNAE
ncbi:MAG TPA: hypothetical protein VFC84_08185 [Desulfosporosinus sp.]|nr:hypothetical protein [Desulfosporosinus sp.]